MQCSQKMQINDLLRGFFKSCFTARLCDFVCSLHEVDSQLFKSMKNSQHCINCLVPDTKKHCILYKEKKSPTWTSISSLELTSACFVNRCLYKFIWCMLFIFYYSDVIYHVLTTYSHVCTYTLCCMYLIKISQHQQLRSHYPRLLRCKQKVRTLSPWCDSLSPYSRWPSSLQAI